MTGGAAQDVSGPHIEWEGQQAARSCQSRETALNGWPESPLDSISTSSLAAAPNFGARTETGITLFAGFASTVGWPTGTWLVAHYGWRVSVLL